MLCSQKTKTENNIVRVFFGRNDAKAETPVLCSPHAKSWLIGKDSDAGRDWGQEEMSLLFNMLSRLVIAFLPRSKCLFNFMAAVTICSDFGAQENVSLLPFFPIYLL